MPGKADSVLTLDQRIAAALSDDTKSSDVEALAGEVETAVAQAEHEAVEARARALDPGVADPTEARAALTDAEFACDRLKAALPRLQARHREIDAAERYTSWRVSYDDVVACQAALADKLKALYPAFEAAIIPLLDSIQEVDNEAIRLSFRKPLTADYQHHADGCEPRTVEQMARGGGGLSIMKDMRLPAWAGSPVAAWPPWRPLGVGVVASYAIPAGPSTPEQVAARNDALRAEAERVAAFYEAQERAREEREATEARAAQERDIEHRRQAGWG
jgi:hypothetical protein